MAEVKVPQTTFELSHFGLGQIYIELLHELPFSKVILAPELCKAFAYGCNKEIMLAVTAMAKSLGKIVIAEKINNKQQYLAIKQVNCHLGAGKFFSEALDWPQIMERVIDRENLNNDNSVTSLVRAVEH